MLQGSAKTVLQKKYGCSTPTKQFACALKQSVQLNYLTTIKSSKSVTEIRNV